MLLGQSHIRLRAAYMSDTRYGSTTMTAEGSGQASCGALFV
jgi:hypothetical protein